MPQVDLSCIPDVRAKPAFEVAKRAIEVAKRPSDEVARDRLVPLARFSFAFRALYYQGAEFCYTHRGV